MIKNNQKSLNRTHVVLDACIIAASYGLAWYIIIESGACFLSGKGVLPPPVYFIPLVVIIKMYFVM